MNELTYADKIKIKLSYLFLYSVKKVFPIIFNLIFFFVTIWIFYLNYDFYAFIIKNAVNLEKLLFVIASNVFSLGFIYLTYKIFIRSKIWLNMFKEGEETDTLDLEK